MISDASRACKLELCHKPDAAQAQERMRAFWAGEMLDRPCVSIKAPRYGAVQPTLPQILAPDFDFAAGVRRFEEWAATTFFGGECMPALMPTWGPDLFAAFVGADLVLAPQTDTSWAVPFVEDWSQLPELSITPDNRWWNATLEFCRTATRLGQGRFLVCGLDMHTNADCLSAIRGAEQLCMDLLDQPDTVGRFVKSMDALYKYVVDSVFEATNIDKRGSISWLDMWSDSRTQVVECDFCCMVSPPHFRKFILPSLEFEVSCLDHAMYHLDGIGALAHLDDLLAIPRLHGIQWVQGAGEAPMPEWIDVLQRIQRAGKSVHITVTIDEMKAVHPDLAPEKVFYCVTGCQSESEAQGVIGWLQAHS